VFATIESVIGKVAKVNQVLISDGGEGFLDALN
jgi:hypothetical protein